MNLIIGTRAWFMGEASWADRGVVDCILRLLEQGEISRKKARELLRFWNTPTLHGHPMAPWDNLNFAPTAALSNDPTLASRPSRAEVARLLDDVELARTTYCEVRDRRPTADTATRKAARHALDAARAALLDAVCGKEGA